MNEERTAAMVAAYASGLTMQAIGDAHGVSRERVRQILAKAGVESRRPGGRRRNGASKIGGRLVRQASQRSLGEPAVRAARALHANEGTSYHELGRKFGVSWITMRRVCRRETYKEIP